MWKDIVPTKVVIKLGHRANIITILLQERPNLSSQNHKRVYEDVYSNFSAH